MDYKDCCCFCFSARTGFFIIGVLIIIRFFAEIVISIYHSARFGYVYWYVLPGMIFDIVMTMAFLKVRNNEGSHKDLESRDRFMKLYLILYVIA